METATLEKSIKTLLSDGRTLMRREADFRNIKPRVSTMFITYRCDSMCKTCTMWKRSQKGEKEKEIGFDQWRVVIDKLAAAGIEVVEPFGGNALLRKELLVSVLEYLHKKGITIHLPTNQIGLDDNVIEAIVKYVDYVYLSNDGLGSEQDLVRGVKGASQMAEGAIEKLLRYRKNYNSRAKPLRIICNCTVSKFNIGSLEGVAEYALCKGFDEIDFEYAGEFDNNDVLASQIMGITPNAQYIRQDESILANKHEAAIIKSSLGKIKKKFHKKPIFVQTINIDSLSKKNIFQGTIPHKKCYVERIEVTVDPYGNLVVCPFITNYILGNLLEQPFVEIWNNEKHKYFRKAQNGGRLPMCRSCIIGVQRNPGLAKSLHRIYLAKIRAKFV